MGLVLKLDGVILEYENSTVFGFPRTKALKALGAEWKQRQCCSVALNSKVALSI